MTNDEVRMTISARQSSLVAHKSSFALRSVLPLLDRNALFVRRWQMVRGQGSGNRGRLAGSQKSEIRSQKSELDSRVLAERELRQLWHATRGLWQLQSVSGVFPARLTTAGLSIIAPGQRAVLRVSDSFRQRLVRLSGGHEFEVGVQVVTVGNRIVQHCDRLSQAGNILEQFLVHGLAAELTEALAKLSQSRVMRLAHWKAAQRYSPGYPVLPKLADQRAIFRLLKPERIGVKLTRSFQMVPEYSTSAVIIPMTNDKCRMTNPRT
jgi:5-methyltetrahydrofolate--homocysteine methyltransferase